jgi:hypothetical protein
VAGRYPRVGAGREVPKDGSAQESVKVLNWRGFLKPAVSGFTGSVGDHGPRVWRLNRRRWCPIREPLGPFRFPWRLRPKLWEACVRSDAGTRIWFIHGSSLICAFGFIGNTRRTLQDSSRRRSPLDSSRAESENRAAWQSSDDSIQGRRRCN